MTSPTTGGRGITHEAWQRQHNADRADVVIQAGLRLKECYVEPCLRKAEILRERQKSDRLWKEFVEDTTYEGVALYSLDALYQDVGLRLLVTDLCHDSKQRFPRDGFRELRERLASVRGHPNTEQHFSAEALISTTDTLLDSLEATLADVALDPTSIITTTIPVFDYVNGILDIPPVQPVLESLQQRIARRKSDLQQCDAREEAALNDGDLTTVQEQLILNVTQREDVLALMDEQLAGVKETALAHDKFVVVTDVCQRLLQQCGEFKQEQEQLATQARRELAALQRFITDEALAAQQRRAAASQRYLESERFLRETSTEEERLWQQIRSLELDLGNIAERRFLHLRERVQDVDAMAIEDETHHQVVAVVSAHRALLERTAHTCDQAITAMAVLEREVIVGGCNFVAARRSHALQTLDEMRVDLVKAQFQQFHTTYLDLHTLRCIKEKYLQLLFTDADRAWKMDWLTKPHRDRLTDDISAIQRKQDEMLQRFLPLMEVLLERDIPFEHPEHTAQTSSDMAQYIEQVIAIIQYQKDQKAIGPPVDVTALDGPAPSPSMPQLNPGTPKKGCRARPGMPIPAVYSPRTPREKRLPNAKSSPRIRSPTRSLPAV